MNKKTVFLSLASGILLFLSFPKFSLSYCAFISLIPLFYALQGRGPREAVCAGLMTGFIFNVGLLYWITHVVVHYGNLPLYLGVVVMLLLACYLSCYVALFSAGLVYLRKKGVPGVIGAPLLWTTLEFVKSHAFTGFPWENLACSQYEWITFIQIADVTGIYGITFIIVMVNYLFFDILTNKDKKTVITELITGVALLAIVLGYGTWRVDNVRNAMKSGVPFTISLIQGSIDQSIKWNPRYQFETLEIYRNLSMSTDADSSDLIVWPETAAPFFFQDVDFKHRVVTNIARMTGAHLLFGNPSYLRREGEFLLRNSAYLISPEGETTGRYDKVHLVPFGEYVPMSSLFSFLDKLVEGVGNFIPGKGFMPLEMDGTRIGVLICYEGIFPEIGRQYREEGASILLNLTNDAWYGRTSAPYQHMTMITFRAVENRLYVARAANTGISAIIDPVGTIVTQTELFKRGVLTGQVACVGGSTFYSRHGDIFVYCCMIFLCAIISATVIRRKSYD